MTTPAPPPPERLDAIERANEAGCLTKGEAQGLIAEVRRAQAEIETLRSRLDWIVRNRAVVFEGTPLEPGWMVSTWTSRGRGETYDEAIDAARAAGEKAS